MAVGASRSSYCVWPADDYFDTQALAGASAGRYRPRRQGRAPESVVWSSATGKDFRPQGWDWAGRLLDTDGKPRRRRA
jgi:hypothetical protein